MSVKKTIRFSDELYKKIMLYDGDNFSNKLENALSDVNLNLSDSNSSDNDFNLSDKQDFLTGLTFRELVNKYNDLVAHYNFVVSQFNVKPSFLSSDFTVLDLELIIDDLEFLKSCSKNTVLCTCNEYDKLFIALKKYLSAYEDLVKNNSCVDCYFESFKEVGIL